MSMSEKCLMADLSSSERRTFRHEKRNKIKERNLEIELNDPTKGRSKHKGNFQLGNTEKKKKGKKGPFTKKEKMQILSYKAHHEEARGLKDPIVLKRLQ